eukprot:5990244-Alexandrium_andersonii.AAC.1
MCIRDSANRRGASEWPAPREPTGRDAAGTLRPAARGSRHKRRSLPSRPPSWTGFPKKVPARRFPVLVDGAFAR